jgi:DNA-binding MarR family transcriptional regulator
VAHECTNFQLTTWTELLRAHDLLADRLDAAVRAAGDLSLAEFELLLRLEKAGGQMRMGEVAESLILSKSGATRLVAKLESLGLVRREIPSDNRRSTLALLTEEGAARLGSAAPVFEATLASAFVAPLSNEEMERLSATLQKLIAASGG